jgi:uncharacterized protein (TIGR02996 family)
MDTETVLLQAIHQAPGDDLAWQALGDWLEEQGQAPRAELLRLHRALLRERDGRRRRGWEARVRDLFAGGVAAVVPRAVSSLGMSLALIPAGKFRMGSPEGTSDRYEDAEGPPHAVQISRPFYLGVYPVTQAQYEQVTGSNPSQFAPERWRGRRHRREEDPATFPVENVTWQEAVDFCARLSALPQERSAGRVYRLPTEAEWEYACRAGLCSCLLYHFGEWADSRQANFDGLAPGGPYLRRPTPVGSYAPNLFGLFDMHGNVSEWCADWFDPGYYPRSPRKDPRGPKEGDERILRGGSWYALGSACRAVHRGRYPPESRHGYVGFRAAMAVLRGALPGG